MEKLKCLVFFALCFVSVDSMSIKGPALTRYDPCGLGVIHFDKTSDKHWQGVLHLGLYRNLIEVEIEIHFDKKITIYKTSQRARLTIKDDWHAFKIQPLGLVPKQFVFDIGLEDLGVNDTDIPTVTKFALNNATLCDEAIKASQTVDSLDVSPGTEYHKHVCGRRSLDHTELVSIRTEAKAGDWPWHVAIFIKDDKNQSMYYCGGNVISETAILTAGHCIFKNGVRIPANRITVVAGTSNHKEAVQLGRQILPVSKVVLHPSYQHALSTSDLAVLKVNKLKYTAYVQPICVWGPVYDKANLIGRQATVVGFGHDENDRPSDVLKSAHIMVQNDTTCLAFSPQVYTSLMNEFTICAGYGPSSGTNPRNGDSGGGLVFPVMQNDHKVSWFLRGVLSKCGVSPGHTECDPRYYVVYTDVAPHYGWIYHHSGLQYTSNVIYNRP